MNARDTQTFAAVIQVLESDKVFVNVALTSQPEDLREQNPRTGQIMPGGETAATKQLREIVIKTLRLKLTDHVNTQGVDQSTALIKASESGNLHLVRVLL